MKNIKIRVLFATCLLSLLACTKLTETYEEHTDDGETVYLGAPLDITTLSGEEQVRFNIVLNADPKITKGVLETIDGSIKQEFAFQRRNGGIDTTSVDMNLDEGEYRFSVTMFDNAGNKSLTKEFPVRVLGTNYIQTLGARQISNVNFSKGEDGNTATAEVKFDKIFDGLLETRLYYIDDNEEEQLVVIPAVENEVSLTNFNGGSDVRLVSVYEPINPFNEFIAPKEATATLPPCNSLAEVTASINELDLGTLNSRESKIESFTVQSDACIEGTVKLNVSGEYFGVSTLEEGPFTNEVSLDDISEAQTIYVGFSPNAQVDGMLSATVNVTGTNVIDTEVLELMGAEIGVLGGTQRHPVDMRSGASDIFTDDLDIYQHGSSPEKMWDGMFAWPSANHSAGGLPTPIGFFTVDLGADFNVTEISWMPRQGCCESRSPKKYQYWGLPSSIDPVSAITTTEFNGKPENRIVWQQEMATKGWVSLGQFEKESSDILQEALNSGVYIADDITALNYVRYIRVVVIETFDGPNNGTINFSELDFKVNLDQ